MATQAQHGFHWQHGFSSTTLATVCYVWHGCGIGALSDTGTRQWRSAPEPHPPFLVFSRRSLTRLALRTSCTRPTMMGGAEIRVDDGAARARAQRCMSEMCVREAEQREGGSSRW